MENYKTLIVAAVGGVVVLVGTFVFGPVRTIVERQVEKQVGALSSPDIPSPYLAWGGVRLWSSSMQMKSATTSICAFQSPAATSTLVRATARFVLASTTATLVDFAKSVSPSATTTVIGGAGNAIAASAQATFAVHATTTGDIDDTTTMFAPNTWFVVGLRQSFTAGDTTGTGSVPNGVCQATFQEVI